LCVVTEEVSGWLYERGIVQRPRWDEDHGWRNGRFPHYSQSTFGTEETFYRLTTAAGLSERLALALHPNCRSGTNDAQPKVHASREPAGWRRDPRTPNPLRPSGGLPRRSGPAQTAKSGRGPTGRLGRPDGLRAAGNKASLHDLEPNGSRAPRDPERDQRTGRKGSIRINSGSGHRHATWQPPAPAGGDFGAACACRARRPRDPLR
jgi:hypothetical protein